MLCKNCHQDIGNKKDCPFCGYNPALDDPGATAKVIPDPVRPQPIRIDPRTSSNGKATAALILSFFGIIVIPGIISFFLAIAGLAQSATCRSGKGKAIVALVIDLFWVIFYAAIISNA